LRWAAAAAAAAASGEAASYERPEWGSRAAVDGIYIRRLTDGVTAGCGPAAAANEPKS